MATASGVGDNNNDDELISIYDSDEEDQTVSKDSTPVVINSPPSSNVSTINFNTSINVV